MGIEVSVIIPAHNSVEFIPKAVDSILRQGFADLEIILVDDGSVDDTPRLAAEYINECGPDKFIYIQQKKSGPASARNVGLLRARGRFIAFLDADDIWTEGSLKTRLDYLHAHPETAMVCADGTNVAPDGSVIDPSYFRSRRPYGDFSAGGFVFDDLFSYILDISLVLTPTVIVRRECFDAVGNFDPTLSVGEDKELWFRIGRKFRIVALPEVMLLRLIHDRNISHGEMVRRVAYTAIGDKVRLKDPVYYQEHRAQFRRWQATMHHEMGYFLFEEEKFSQAAIEQMASLREQFRFKSLFDLVVSLFAALLGKRIFSFFRTIKHHCL